MKYQWQKYKKIYHSSGFLQTYPFFPSINFTGVEVGDFTSVQQLSKSCSSDKSPWMSRESIQMCFQHLDKSAHVPALHYPITISIHHHLKLTPGEGTQHVCLYLCPNCSNLRGSDTHRRVVSSSLLWVKSASEISV